MGTFVFDIDGTLSKSGEKVNSAICDSIFALSKDNEIIFASARPVRDMLPMLSKNLEDSLFIGCNGAMAYRKGEIIYKNMLCKNRVNQLVDYLKEREIPYVLDGFWNYSFSQQQHVFHDYIRSLSAFECDEKTLIDDGITKILILSNTSKKEIINIFSEDSSLSIHTHRADDFYDITSAGNNKFRTLSLLSDTKNYFAFGNDQNDFLVLDNARISVFLGEKHIYPDADYHVEIDYIPTLLSLIKNKYLSSTGML